MSEATVTAETVDDMEITMMNTMMEAEAMAEQAAGTMKTMTTTDVVMLETAVIKTRSMTKTTMGGERRMMKTMTMVIMGVAMLETAVMNTMKMTMIARAVTVIEADTREGALAA